MTTKQPGRQRSELWSSGPARVVILDDDPATVSIVSRALGVECALEVAAHPVEVLALRGAASPPDLILLDIEMPEANGIEICRALKSDPTTRDIPVIIVTSHTDEADEREGLRAGAIDYVTKPISPELLRIRVRNHVMLHRLLLQWRDEAMIDPLTGLANRRRFEAELATELARGQREGAPTSLLMIDVDHFRRFNNSFGHPGGDVCLQEVSRVISSVLRRPADLAGRWGGEEFVVMLPGTDLPGARTVAQALLAAVRRIRISFGDEHEGLSVIASVTVSVGIAAADDSDSSVSDLVERADQALYWAKSGGRDCLRVSW